MAYVGGGFGRAGLHSVLEPAAWGLPVAFGPRWQDSRDAELLVDAGAGVAVSDQNEMARHAGTVASDETAREAVGERGECWWSGSWGGARSAEVLDGLIRHDALERHRARHDEPSVNSGEEKIAPAAPNLDLHVGDTVGAAELTREGLPQRGLLEPHDAPEAEHRLARSRKRSPWGGWPAGEARVAGTPSVVASKVWAHPARAKRRSAMIAGPERSQPGHPEVVVCADPEDRRIAPVAKDAVVAA